MFKPKETIQSEYEFVSIEELVSGNHLLRLIDKYVDFSFLLEKYAPFIVMITAVQLILLSFLK